MRLKDRIAIVTGAARGIGLAIARRFAAEGAAVVIADVLDEAGEQAARTVNATYVHCDVSKAAEVAALVSSTIERHGAVDILVNNAAINLNGGILDVSEADFDRVIGINLKGSFLMLQACARQMVKQAENGRKPGSSDPQAPAAQLLQSPDRVGHAIGARHDSGRDGAVLPWPGLSAGFPNMGAALV